MLDVCWGRDDKEAFSGGLDCDAQRIDLETGELSTISTHDAPVKSVAYSHEHSLLISASWDSTLHVHDRSDPEDLSSSPTSVSLPSKPFSISLSRTKLVVAMASRALHIYDLAALKMLSSQASNADATALEVEPWQRRESSLKFMTRAVSCMPDDVGYASSSIEGRVAVEWFDPSPESQARKYAFKCHRQTTPDGADIIYPVNALAFHPVHGTFASGGGDGVVILWDGVAKRRIRQYQKYPSSIAALSFSSDGKHLAIGVSPGFEDGREDFGPQQGKIGIWVRELGENEAKGKGTK